jgi:hypothetical protein
MLVAVRERVEKKIASATLERSPFPHLVIEEFFPADVYAKIMAYNPFKDNRGVEWAPKSHSKETSSRTPYFARKQINFHASDPFDAPPEARAFWEEMRDVFLKDHWFDKLVAASYPEYFSIRFGDLFQDADFHDQFKRELFLQRHEPGYYIGPHTDIPTRVFTCIFSFAEREGFEEYGTQLLAHKDRLTRCSGYDHYGFEDFTVKKIAPYKPNNFLLFFKTRQSFHSVAAIDETVPNQRYGMQFQYYEPARGLFNDLSNNQKAFQVKQKGIGSRILEKLRS